MGRQKLAEDKDNRFSLHFAAFTAEIMLKVQALSYVALNATRACSCQKTCLFFPCALCETSLNPPFSFGQKLDDDEALAPEILMILNPC